MASDALNGLFLVLTGSQMPDADPVLMREHLVVPQRELEEQLARLQELLVQVTQSASGTSSSEFSEASYRAMLTLASPEGQTVLAGLRDAARELGDFADESAYQVEYMNLMIVKQLGMFAAEFAATFVMAVFNPVGALLRQAYLRAFYRMVLNSVVARVLASIATQQVLQIGIAAAMDRLAQCMLAGGEGHDPGGQVSHPVRRLRGGGRVCRRALAVRSVLGRAEPGQVDGQGRPGHRVQQRRERAERRRAAAVLGEGRGRRCRGRRWS
ncbi:hypothetical protein ABZX40_39155 [Streptomyces sp. NPDC004610]|uniref:WXG100-like domain-containing protein n=1 Tax=unclassified Streptomyces TaxID=2593676 RepID=UPI0033B180B2